MAKGKTRARGWVAKDGRLFTLEVCIVGGPMTEKFIKKNKVVSRTIQIRGDQTLEDLHCAIFDAFDREDEHMYEFQVGGKGPMDPKARRYGKGPMDPKARRYVLSGAFGNPMPGTPRAAGDLTRTTVGSLASDLNRLYVIHLVHFLCS